MSEKITADFETLVRQAPMLTEDLMRTGADKIDQVFGEGYSDAKPVLVAAFMLCSMMDFSSGVLAQQIREGLEARL